MNNKMIEQVTEEPITSVSSEDLDFSFKKETAGQTNDSVIAMENELETHSLYIAIKNGKQLFVGPDYKYHVVTEGQVPREITSGVFEDVQRVYDLDKDQEYYVLTAVLRINGVLERKKNIKIIQSDLTSTSKMEQAIGFLGFTISANGDLFALLKEAIRNMANISVEASSICGLHNNGFLLPNGYLTTAGLIKHQLILTKKLDFNHERFYQFPVPTEEQWRDVSKEFMSKSVGMNEMTKMLVLIGWFLSAPLRQFLLRKDIQPGVLTVYGTKGSGKSSTTALFLKFMGHTHTKGIVTTKIYTLMKLASMFNGFAIWIDEYRESKEISTELKEFLRAGYDGANEYRGQSNLSSESYPLMAPLILTGEDQPNDPATSDRLCPIKFKPHERTVNGREEAYMDLERMQNKSFFIYGYLEWLLHEFNNLEDILIQARQEVNSLQVFQDIRPLKTGVGVMFGLLLGIRLMNHLKMETSYSLEDAKEAIRELATTIEKKRPQDPLLLTMYEIRERCQEILKSDYDIRNNSGKLVGYFKQSNVLDHITKQMRGGITKESLRQLFRESMESSGIVTGESQQATVQGKNARCLVVDLTKLCDEYPDEFEIEDWTGLMPLKNVTFRKSS